MERFPSAEHLASWAGMCPGQHVSAGKRLGGRSQRGSPWLRSALTEAAWGAARTKGTYLAAQYRRIAARRGKQRAIVAVGHSILVSLYHMLTEERDDADLGGNFFDERERELVQRRLVRRLEQLGLTVTVEPAPAPAPAPAKAAKAAKKASGKAAAPEPPVPMGDDAWTKAELKAVRKELEEQAAELRGEIDTAEAQSESLKRDQSSEGSGDEADAGTKTFEREHEMSLANNSRDLLVQVERALGRIDAGTYGRCENCGNPIPKARLQAFPRATLCVTCKQREERR